jgi:Arginine/lysine/ornithine decarboxylases
MARNCHKAIYNALLLADIQPVYAYPEMIHEYGISGEITADEIEKCLKENSDAEAVILPSPNYYGICSDIRKIAEVVHKYGKVLIVDQAHGAHLKFFDDCGFTDMPKGSETEGADITVNSIHKTLASYTQSALLNLNSDRVDRYVLEDKLQMIQSTSPSYLLMSSLDINCDILHNHKQEVIGDWHDALMYFYRETMQIPGLDVIGNPFAEGAKIRLDITKINLDMSKAGLNAAELEEELIKRHIYAELTTGNILMCMTGIGNTRSDMEKLLAALKEISTEHYGKAGSVKKQVNAVFEAKLTLHPVPKNRERIPLAASCGRICASSIIPYPPGIPFICPGEELTQEVIEYIAALRASGEKVIGVTPDGEIFVGK